MVEHIIINLTVFSAFFLKGIAGFGNTLVMNGSLSFIRQNRFITPLDTLLGLPVNIFLVIREWKYIRFSLALPLLVSVGGGIVPGILLLDSVNDRILKSILAVVLIAVGLDFFREKKKYRETEYTKLIVLGTGFVSGILTGLYGIGVLVPAALSRIGLDRRDFRGSICFVFTAESIMRITGYILKGIINKEIFFDFIFLIPAAASGVILSRFADRRADDNFIRRIVFSVLMLSAVILLIRNRFSLF